MGWAEGEGGMERADFWCRILGWLQIGGAVATGLCIYGLWALFFGWVELHDPAFFNIILALFILVLSFPALLAGVLTLSFAGYVAEARQGRREEAHVLFRVIMALAGLWSAGVIGFLGINLPAIGFFAILGLATAAIAIMGQDWTADLLETPRG
jgi:hypothetical protein